MKDTATALDIIKLVIAKGGKVDAKLKSAALQRQHTPGEPLLGAGTTPLMRAAEMATTRPCRCCSRLAPMRRWRSRTARRC